MRWRGERESGNIEDRRGMSGGGLAMGGIGGLLIAVVIYFLGGDPTQVMQQPTDQVQTSAADPNDTLDRYISVVLASTEDAWTTIFNNMNRQYTDPTLVLFSGQTQAGCGFARAASGPFYCPADQKVYIDLSFFDELTNRFGASGGDFAMAYVLAHEVGHHVQHLLGLTDQVDRQRQHLSESGYNKLSVKLELQADFLAGVWAHYNRKNLESGDIEEALSAASAVGDDRIQKQSQGYVVPDGFTHGTSEQRMYWFKKGYTTGDISQGDTFSDPSLN
jgi:predicted metalloprotease